MFSQKDSTAAARPTPGVEHVQGLLRHAQMRVRGSLFPENLVLMPPHAQAPHSPLNMGASFHTPSPPMEVYWPREHSRRKRGTPAKMSVRKYGIRKAPGEKKHTHSSMSPQELWGPTHYSHMSCLESSTQSQAQTQRNPSFKMLTSSCKR